MLRLLLLDAALHAAEGSVHALDEAVLDLLVVLLHLQEEQTCPSPMGHSDSCTPQMGFSDQLLPFKA